MANEPKSDLTIELLYLQRWLAERHERANEALSLRAITILGFLGVEIAVFSVVVPKDFQYKLAVIISGFISAILFLGAIVCLSMVFRAKEFYWPSHDEVELAFELSPEDQLICLKTNLTTPKNRKLGIFANLERENRQMEIPFRYAVRFTLATQFSIVVLLGIMWGSRI